MIKAIVPLLMLGALDASKRIRQATGQLVQRPLENKSGLSTTQWRKRKIQLAMAKKSRCRNRSKHTSSRNKRR